MPDKRPNLIFSREKDRLISPTEARFGRFLSHLSSTKRKRAAYATPRTTMSPLLASQPQQNRAVDGNVSDNTNGLDTFLDNGTQGSLSSTSFGVLHERIRSEVDKLEGGLESVTEAVSKLAKTFREQENMIHTVQERFGKDQDLEREIGALRAGNREMWRLRREEAEQHKSRILELEEEAKEVQEQKRAIEWQSITLRDEYNKKEQIMKRENEEKQRKAREELERRKAKLESENERKIAEFEATKLALTKANQELKQNLEDKSTELEKEKAIWQRIQTSLLKEIDDFKGELKQIQTNYAVEERPLEHYADKYKEIFRTVDQISKTYFTDLPESARHNPAGTSDILTRKSRLFQHTPILLSDCSKVLRIANVQQIICNVVCDHLWIPFSSAYIWAHDDPRKVLEEMHSNIAADGEQVQRYWKISTLKALDRLDASMENTPLVKRLVDTVVDTLRPLLDHRVIAQCQDDLHNLITRCIDIGKIAERDRNPIKISRNPKTDVNGWLEYFDGTFEAPTDAEQLSAPIEAQNPQYLTPKVYRPATATTEEFVICPGFALFPRSGIFQEGRKELEDIEKKIRELGTTVVKGARKASSGSAAFARPILSRDSSSGQLDTNAMA